ncbi:SAICAR synthase-like protein [Peniophora sp. CONT]|nr:SAICAR synthase-like protein [Peniophora sp. CONT]
MRSLGQGEDEDGVPAALADDIQAQADQIRRERHSKRLRGEGAGGTELNCDFVAGSTSDEKADKVAVGNVIGEGHANYVLMYNMLTGIRIAVSRCQAKITHALTPEDFGAAHKYSFDIIGNELTPSAKYDFKFKDYAPFVFRDLRERHFRLDPADYLLSLTAKYILSELGSPGKSGSFFYFSRDYRFIIKTIHHTEHAYLRRILPRYYEHVKNNPHTLVSRFYGLHRVKLPRGRKIHFVIMNNLFPAHKDIHETYDLKGSTVGRLYPEERARANPRAVLKDLNWIARGKSIELGPEKRALLTEQLRRDASFLREVGVMDYSLLIGIHKLERGNRDNVRRNTLKVFSPDVPPARDGTAVRRLMRTAPAVASLPDHLAASPGAQSLFYQDEGGLRATDERNKDLNTIYYLGVIDILTPFRLPKKLEGIWKGLRADRHKISPVPPDEYGTRFVAFMQAVMRGGGGAKSFVSPSDLGLLHDFQGTDEATEPAPVSPDDPISIEGGMRRRQTSVGSRSGESRRSTDGSRRSGEGALASPRGAVGARGGFGGMREHAEPRGGYGEVAAAAMAAGAPMPDSNGNGYANGKENGYMGGMDGDGEAYASGANARNAAHWKADAQGPQRREYIRRWS